MSKLIESLLKERKVLIDKLTKIDDLLKEYGTIEQNKDVVPILSEWGDLSDVDEILKDVNSDNFHLHKISKKILFILNQLGSGTVEDVSKKLVELIPNYKPSRVYEDPKHWLSRLNRQGIIGAEKSGKKINIL